MIICAAIKDKETGAIFGGIRHGFIYSAMKDAGIPKRLAELLKVFLTKMGIFIIEKKHLKLLLIADN